MDDSERVGVSLARLSSSNPISVVLVLVLTITLALTLGVDIPAVDAQSPEPLPAGVTWDEVNAIASQMYCDVSEGVPLDECESLACRRWRNEIALQLADGRTEDEIIAYFVERYGAEVAALPRDATDRFVAFAIPIGLAILLGLVGLYQMQQLRQRGQQSGQVIRRSTTNPHSSRPVPDDIDPEYLKRVEREIAKQNQDW